MFQFHNGTINTWIKYKYQRRCLEVSIPQWYDKHLVFLWFAWEALNRFNSTMVR